MNLINTLKEWKIQILNVQHLQILGLHFIDSDFFVAFRTKNGEIVPIEILAEEISTHSKKATEEIIRASKEKGVNEGNSLYYYANATFKPDDPEKLYNNLKFIGTFKDPRKKFR